MKKFLIFTAILSFLLGAAACSKTVTTQATQIPQETRSAPKASVALPGGVRVAYGEQFYENLGVPEQCVTDLNNIVADINSLVNGTSPDFFATEKERYADAVGAGISLATWLCDSEDVVREAVVVALGRMAQETPETKVAQTLADIVCLNWNDPQPVCEQFSGLWETQPGL